MISFGLRLPELEEIFAKVTYKPGWNFEVRPTDFEGAHLHIWATIEDAYHPGRQNTLHIESPLPPMRDEDEVLHWLLWRLERIEIHELREWLCYNGQRRWDPHDGVERT